MVARPAARPGLIQVAFGSFLVLCVFSITLRHGEASPEAHAILALKTLHSAQVMFAASCGNGGYATSIEELAAPPPGASDAFLPATFAQTLTNVGYRVTLQAQSRSTTGPTSCRGAITHTGYFAIATPLSVGEAGQRSFATETSGVIWQTDSASPAALPREGATLIR